MIPNQTTTATVTSTMPGTSYKAQIKAAAMGAVMSVLAGLYSNKEKAIIREYSTNARDSHIEARQTRPIEVTTPGPFNPYLVIKDYGVGMDRQALDDTYRNYGDSTKQGSDEFNGTLGMGSKSAFSYAEQFNVTGIKNGIKTQILVSKAEDGSGDFTVVSETPTDEPNGVEIKIPTEKYNDLASEAKEFFRYWPAGTVLLNGKDPHVDLTHIADDTYTSERTMPDGSKRGTVTVSIFTDPEADGDYIVMGGVAYPTASIDMNIDTQHSYYRNFGVIAYVEMGEIAFTPSRESLLKCKLSQRTVEAVSEIYKRNILEAAKRDIESAPDGLTAIKRLDDWRTRLNIKIDAKWKDMSVPYGNMYAGTATTKQFIFWDLDAYRRSVTNRTLTYSLLNKNEGVLFVTNFASFDKGSVSATQKAKVKEYLVTASLDQRTVVFLPDATIPGAEWVTDPEVVDWTTVNAIKLNPNASRGGGGGGKVYNGAYDVLQSNGYFSVETVSTTDNIYYFVNKDTFVGAHYNQDIEEYASSIRNFLPSDATIVKVGGGRIDKFKRLFPAAKHVRDGLVNVAKEVADALTDDDLNVLAYQGHHLSSRIANKFKPEDFDDPEYAALVSAKSYRTTATLQNYYTARNLFKGVDAAAKLRYTEVKSNPGRHYPLVTDFLSVGLDDVPLYINAKYAARVAAKVAAKAAKEGK